MKRITLKYLRTGLLAGALGLVLLPSARAQDAAKPPDSAIPTPRLDYKETKLPNGLKVVTLEDHRAPVVTLQIWYRVGSKDEAKGKAGFAHMFEHLMFKGSEHVPTGAHTRYIEQVGGDYNAETSFDRTLYYETVPSNALDRMLYLEADRMASLKVDEPNMISERAVVEEEHRLHVENSPYGALLEVVQAQLFPAAHPYAHTTIGNMSDLDSAKLSDVKAFHDQYYKPDNATLVLVGDFRTADALAQINKYFAPIPKSAKPFTRYPVIASRQTVEQHKTVYDKLAPLPMVIVGFRLPATEGQDAKDLPALDVITNILSSGSSSRMHRSLVRDQQIAVEAGGQPVELKLGGLYFFYAVANAGKSPEQLEKAVVEQTELLRAQAVSPAELDKAKNQAISSKVFGTISTEAKATQLGEADLLYGTPEEANQELSKLQAVTAADIQRVAQKYFGADQRNVIYMLPAAMQKTPNAPKSAKSAQKATEKNTVAHNERQATSGNAFQQNSPTNPADSAQGRKEAR